MIRRKKLENYRLPFSFIRILEREFGEEVKEINLFDFRLHFFISFLFPFPSFKKKREKVEKRE
jgi:hypothetical protein